MSKTWVIGRVSLEELEASRRAIRAAEDRRIRAAKVFRAFSEENPSEPKLRRGLNKKRVMGSYGVKK